MPLAMVSVRWAIALGICALLLATLPVRGGGACPRAFSGAWNFCGDERPAGKWFDPTAPGEFAIVAVATAKRQKRFVLTSDGPVAVSEARYWQARDGFTETETKLAIDAVLKGEIGDVTYVRTSRAGVCGANGPEFALGRQYVLFFPSPTSSRGEEAMQRPPAMAFAACYAPQSPWYREMQRQLAGVSTAEPPTR